MAKEESPGRRNVIGLAAIALLIPLLIYAAAAIHVRYMADDYCTIVSAREHGVLGNVAHVYQTWAGSFSTVAIMSITGISGLAVEQVVLLSALGVWWLLLADLFWRAARWRALPNARSTGAAAASVLCLAVLSGAPNLTQSLYWTNGRVAYFLPIVLMTAVAWLLVQAQAWESRQAKSLRLLLLLLIGALAFALGGFAISCSLATVSLFGLAIVAWRKQPVARYLVFALGMALAGLVIFVLAPGNAARQSHFATPDLIFTLKATLTIPAWPGMLSVYLSPFATLAALLFPLGVARYRDPGVLAHPVRAILLIPAVLFGLVAVCFAPAFYAMSAPLPGRIWILPQCITLAGLMAWGYGVGLATRKTALRPMPNRVRVGAWLLLAAVVISTTIDALAVNRALGDYAAAWDRRDRALQAVEDRTTPVVIPMFDHVFGLEDIAPEPGGWVNTCIAAYYGLESITGAEE